MTCCTAARTVPHDPTIPGACGRAILTQLDRVAVLTSRTDPDRMNNTRTEPTGSAGWWLVWPNERSYE